MLKNSRLSIRSKTLSLHLFIEIVLVKSTATFFSKCDAVYGMERDAEGHVIRSPSATHRRLAEKEISKKRVLSAEYIEYMNRFVDWEVERLIGYYPRQK